MHVTINGNNEEIQEGLTILELLKMNDIDPSRIAIEFNLKVLPKKNYDKTAIRDGDKIEIVHFVGGG
ncbi:MAG: sulfur carrier protein ThiS [Thermodesulfobacteriota bacterium]|nr:sulfur carrier protein ThiS [Thermodesulfobacteriota bacterium]